MGMAQQMTISLWFDYYDLFNSRSEVISEFEPKIFIFYSFFKQRRGDLNFINLKSMTSKPQLNIRAKALYRFVPENEEELDLNEGDVVIIYEKHDDGWCVGNFDGKVGYFPAAYIEELPPPQQRPVKAAPSTPKLAEAPPLEIKQVGTPDNASPATTPHSARPTLKSADDSGINARPTGSPRQLPNPGHGTMRKGKFIDLLLISNYLNYAHQRIDQTGP
jgi:hypothetical protein